MKNLLGFRNENVLISFLRLLNVKHTLTFSRRYFNEHPHKYNLFGLSKMLSDYGVENAATKIKDKENDIFNIDTPFIAFSGNDFIPVYKITQDSVSYVSKNGNVSISPKEFCNFWTGITLLAEPSSRSIEPNYKENRKKERFTSIQKLGLLSCVFIIFLLTYISKDLYNSPSLTINLAIMFMGIYTGYLLIKKQMHIQSEYVDKICSLFKQSDCNNVLESKAAKLFGLIGWGEIGFGYFISNVLIILFLPHLISYLTITNICVLPYSFWSIWYQKIKVKQWCPLCLIVQGLLWSIFIVNLAFGFIKMPIFNISDMLTIACIYLIPPLTINILSPQVSESEKMAQITQEINSIKANENILLTLLKQQPCYDVNKYTSKILFGNPNANILITIFTNPHCNPCAKMHSRVENFLKGACENICIQYIFSAFEDNLLDSNRLMIAAYLSKTEKERNDFYNLWFKVGKNQKDKFLSESKLDIHQKAVEEELQKHQSWKEKTGLRATPIILVNGYKLPENYKIEDLKYFSNLEIDSK
ncbi:MAG: Vitamin epoxide reductase family protein [Bacteroidetes bacterium]|nr:Vitamin epoxide reductase family protein [Bacteroidota bacterium]